MVNGKEEVVEEVVIENRMLGGRTDGGKGGGECSRQGEDSGGTGYLEGREKNAHLRQREKQGERGGGEGKAGAEDKGRTVEAQEAVRSRR